MNNNGKFATTPARDDFEKDLSSPIPVEEIMAQLVRILASVYFVSSARLSRFLKYTVERAAAGKPHELKEYTIGVEVYDRKPPYHPNEDSIVRSEARRLRSKLKQYYESDGKADRIQFYYRPGSYVPVFRSVEDRAPESQSTKEEVLEITPKGVLFVVFPFSDDSGSPLASNFAHGLTDEVLHWIMRAEGCRAIAYSTLQHLLGDTLDAASIARELGAQVALEGAVREDGGRIRVTCTFISLPGLERWSERFEAQAAPPMIFEIVEQMATALVGRFAPQSSKIRYRRRNASPEEVAYYPALLAGEALIDRGDKVSIQHALDKFTRIEQEQPLCARASCGIAQAYYWLAMLGDVLGEGRPADALRAADRALSVDAEMIEAHAARGCALMLKRDWQAAETSFDNAIRLGSYAPAYRLYGELLTSRGRFDEAFQMLEQAQEMDPFSYRQKLAYSRFLYMSRRFEDCLAYRSTLKTYGPIPPEVSLIEAMAHVALGHPLEAVAMATAVIRSAAGALPLLADACGILALSGERAKALSLSKTYRLLDGDTSIATVRKAMLALALEDFPRAESYFEAAVRMEEAEICWFAVDTRCDRAAQFPYFGAILKAISA